MTTPHFAIFPPDEADDTMGNPRTTKEYERLKIICSYLRQARKCVRINCPIAPIVQIAQMMASLLLSLFWPQKNAFKLK